MGAAEQVGGNEARALVLGPRVLEEDRGTAWLGASERSADHAWLQGVQLCGAATGRWKNRGREEAGGSRLRRHLSPGASQGPSRGLAWGALRRSDT